MDLVRAHAPRLTAPHWIMAEAQSAGRGRKGRSWFNMGDGFAATLIFRPDCDPAQAALRSFVAAVALTRSLSHFVPDALLSQKWPNDVLLAGGKVAGILLESAGSARGLDWLAIGIGVNLGAAPDNVPDAAFAPTGLAPHAGERVDRADFLRLLASHYAAAEAQFTTHGFDPIRGEWMARAARLGDTITARTERDAITGRFDGIDGAGNLLLLTPAGQRTIPAADIFF